MRRNHFLLPEGVYLDGNSLGPIPKASKALLKQRIEEWQYEAVSAWEKWFHLAESLSPSLAKLLGANPDEVITTGSITSNLHALLGTFYKPKGTRKNILVTALDFSSDVYVAESWAKRGKGKLIKIPSRDGHTLHSKDISKALTEDIAVAVLPTVLYRSGQLLDTEGITKAAHKKGILVIWDAAHSIGAVPHQLHDWNVDFAVWCTYKYLNAGPGSPGGLFVHETHVKEKPGLPGWWGHQKHTQFEMRHDFRPAEGAGAYQMGTPGILSLTGLEGSLKVFDEVGIETIRKRSLELTQYFMDQVDKHLPEMIIRTPRKAEERGGHVVLEHPEAQRLSIALRQRQVIPDYRSPNLLRMTPTALYNNERDIDIAVQTLRTLLDTKVYLEVDIQPGVN
jgi:kynureninase